MTGEDSKFAEYYKMVMTMVDNFAETNWVMRFLAYRTNMEPKKLIRGIIGCILLLLLILSFQTLFTSIFCSCIPMYMSMKAMVYGDDKATRLCLNYWVLYSLFCIFEVVFYPIVYFIPMWSVCKCMILVWLYLPNYQGGAVIMRFLEPLFSSQQDRLDKIVQRFPGGFSTWLNENKDGEIDDYAYSVMKGTRDGYRNE
jgi:hypothetical protein